MAEYNKAQRANFYGETPRRDLLKFASPHARSWLDIGCGTGTTTRAILDAGMREVHGVEVNPAAVAVARSRLPTVFEVDLDTDHSWHPPQRYDVVSFFDMLEHLQDPWSLLRRAQGWLNPGGSVIASLPNLRFWPVLQDLVFAKRFSYVDHGVTDRTHLRFFTRSGMEDLFGESGYRVLRIEGINASKPWGKARIAFALLPRLLDDARYLQFVVVAVPATGGTQGPGTGQA
jgi:2-polyprenyl-3-methyl-5-hydroxy-6-metoxy-1,4-benzoquinol methylase